MERSLRFRPGKAMRRQLLLIGATVVLIGATYVSEAGWLQAVPSETSRPIPDGAGAPIGDPASAALPAGDDPAAERGPDGRLSLNEQIAFWSGRAEANPGDTISLLYLAAAEMAKARLSADLDLYQRAGALLDRAAQVAPGYVETRRLEASLAYTLHDFARAADIARKLHDADGADVRALGILADALTELGRYDEARQRYEELATLTTGPAVDARRARFAWVMGDPDAALSLARNARNLAVAEPTTNDVAFYEYQLGEMARLEGDRDLARHSFQNALRLRPRDLGALVGLARVEAAVDPRVAIALLRRATAVAPQAESLALLGDLLTTEGRTAEASVAYDTVRTLRKLSELTSSVYDRQLLLFELDHAGASSEVLARAQDSLEARGDIFGWDLVAWANYRLGRYRDAATAMDAALATGCRDARMLFHAGAIALATGERMRGAALLREALSLGPALDPLQTDEARTLLHLHARSVPQDPEVT